MVIDANFLPADLDPGTPAPTPGDAGAPLVYMESLAAGLPVLSFPPTAVASTIESDGTGLVADRTDALPAVLTAVGGPAGVQ